MNNNFNVEEETLFKVSNETNNSINEEIICNIRFHRIRSFIRT